MHLEWGGLALSLLLAQGTRCLLMTWHSDSHLEGDSEDRSEAQSLTDAWWFMVDVCFLFWGDRRLFNSFTEVYCSYNCS